MTGAGIRVTVDGAIPGDALEQVLNELRNAGAEAIAIGPVRVVAGVVPNGPIGSVMVGGLPVETPVEIVAVGQPQTLAGSLTRAGGAIAQLGGAVPRDRDHRHSGGPGRRPGHGTEPRPGPRPTASLSPEPTRPD